ncbi:MAG: DUF1846 domain-containing protein [Bacilli bacterium]|nr:DUF1846 domain-containing protein [Bacilli bacterium]
MKKGFDNKKYIKIQSKAIKERFRLFDKLYLEIGGKLFDDYHAARVLPGFKKDAKISIFRELKNDLEIIFCISANDIEKNKTRAEFGITYDMEVMRLIDNLTNLGFCINSVVITLYNHQSSVDNFIKKLERHNIKTYIHTYTKGYPSDVDTIVSDEGYGANPYIETTKRLVLVNAPGPGSGKLATCLSQLYHEHKRGINAGYAKFETFPVWDLPLKHPLNVAYEAATADLNDINMIDSFHLEEYNVTAVNYNRDLAAFPVLKTILSRITNSAIYKSPTDMGVNKISKCIMDNKIVDLAAKKEIVRRYYQEMVNYKMGMVDIEVPTKIKLLMNELGIDENILEVINKTTEKSNKENKNVLAIKLHNNKIITGKESDLLSAPSALVINAIKTLSKIPDNIDLLSPYILEPILKQRKNHNNNPLQLQEVIIALSICSVTNPMVEQALTCLDKLKDCEAHASYIVTSGDKKSLSNLGIRLTCEAKLPSNNLFFE